MTCPQTVIDEHLHGVDVDQLARDYHAQDEFVFAPSLLGPIARRLQEDYERVRPRVRRMHVPGIRKAGTVAQRHIREAAPWMHALYHCPAFLELISAMAGKPLRPKAPHDDNACALYVYDRAADGMRLHYDRCSAHAATVYTALVGVIDNSTMRLRCELFHADEHHATERRDIETIPGSVAFFCGSKLYHGATPLGSGEERVVLSLSYESEHTLGRYEHFKEQVRDTLVYFGVSGLLSRMRKEP